VGLPGRQAKGFCGPLDVVARSHSEIKGNDVSETTNHATEEKTSAPRVTIGLPVYNGENYLAEAIDSILGQTFTNFELIISDNASTDRTEEICRTFADQDERIRYFRHDRNRGASPNYNFTVEKARGEYFKWAAHDDVLHPTFLEEAVKALDVNPDLSLVYSKTRTIDEHGEVLGTYDQYEDRLRIDAPDAHTRFGDMICARHNCIAVFGLMRTDQLVRTNLHAAFQGADRTLLAEMALRGPMLRIPEYLFDRRDHPGAYTRKEKGLDRIAWWDADQAEKITLPTWRRLREYSQAINRVGLPRRERLASYAKFARWLISPRWYYRPVWIRLVRELFSGARRYGLRLAKGLGGNPSYSGDS
jgi:glycosyltransferase involved in cell wall biosynthesis